MRRLGTRYTIVVVSMGSILAVLLAAAPRGSAEPREDDLPSLRLEFQRQSDPVKRAKLFPRLGSALLAEMKKEEEAKEYERVAPLFIEYRDGASAAFTGLSSTGHDAEKHPNGYRELEMHLRRSLHQLNDIVYGVPLDDREALAGPQRDIENLVNRLVKALFPRGPQARDTWQSTGNWLPLG